MVKCHKPVFAAEVEVNVNHGEFAGKTDVVENGRAEHLDATKG